MTDMVTYTPSGSAAIPIYKWDGELRPTTTPVYNHVDQDGTIGGDFYKVDDAPREIEVVIWMVNGGYETLKAKENTQGKLVFWDSTQIVSGSNTGVRLLEVIYKKPMGRGTSAGSPMYEEMTTRWAIEE